MKGDSKVLDRLIEKGESQNLEFVSKTEGIGKSICAFANTNNGVIVVGVDDSGKIIGTKEKNEQLIANIAHSCKPSIYPEVEKIKVNGKVIFIINVKKSGHIHSFKNVAYKRVSTHDKPLSPEEVVELAKETGKITFDSSVCEDALLKDIDPYKVKWYLERREKIRKVPKEIDTKTLLTSIGAAKEAEGKVGITNTGVLFFARDPQKFIPIRIIGARFKGTELSRTTTDSVDCSGNLWEMLEQAENFVRKNIKLLGFRTELTFRRIDKLEYPMEAVREAIINALIHRDYFQLGDTRIFIFDDRIEIINPGSFPEGVTPEKPVHKPRNPVLCQIMRDTGFIEKYGSGIYFMKNLCREWGIPEPEYEITKMETKIVFKSGGEGIIIGELEKLGLKMNERQRKALEHALKQGFVTNSVYTEINKVSNKTASLELSDLVRLGLLEVRGKGRSTRYVPKIR